MSLIVVLMESLCFCAAGSGRFVRVRVRVRGVLHKVMLVPLIIQHFTLLSRIPSRYNSSRAKCIKCFFCAMFFSPNKFVFHSHRLADSKYVQPDAANFNSWRRHIRLSGDPPIDVQYAWEDVKAMFNGGTRKRLMAANSQVSSQIPSCLSV